MSCFFSFFFFKVTQPRLMKSTYIFTFTFTFTVFHFFPPEQNTEVVCSCHQIHSLASSISHAKTLLKRENEGIFHLFYDFNSTKY